MLHYSKYCFFFSFLFFGNISPLSQRSEWHQGLSSFRLTCLGLLFIHSFILLSPLVRRSGSQSCCGLYLGTVVWRQGYTLYIQPSMLTCDWQSACCRCVGTVRGRTWNPGTTKCLEWVESSADCCILSLDVDQTTGSVKVTQRSVALFTAIVCVREPGMDLAFLNPFLFSHLCDSTTCCLSVNL